MLGPVETAPKCARGTLIALLKIWGLAHLGEVGEAITSELVTDAVAASRQVAPLGTGASQIVLRLTVRRTELPDEDAEHGRGLFIVNVLSERWGWYLARLGGKYVWAVLLLDS